MDEKELLEQREDIRDMMTGGVAETSTEDEVDHGQETEGEEENRPDSEAEGEVQDEVDMTLEERYANLLQEHNKLSAYVLDQGTPLLKQEERQQTVESEVLPPVASGPKFNLDRDILRKALIEDNEDAMGEVLEGMMSFVTAQISSQREQLRESVLLGIPAMARQITQQEIVLLGAVKEFYEQNEDLQPYQSIVGAMTNEIVAKDPQLTLQQTLERVEKEVRSRLGLKKRIQQADLSGGRGKQFVARPTGSRRPNAPRLEGIREDIAAMQRANH